MNRRLWTTLPITLALLPLFMGHAAAQSEPNVTIDFDVGDFDSARGDWPITAVNVSGDLTSGEAFSVELRDGDGELLWSGSDQYTPPQTTIDVDTFVAVGDVEEAGIAQRQPAEDDPTGPTDPPDPVDPADQTVSVVDAEDEAAIADEPSTEDPPDPAAPDVEGDVTTNPDEEDAIWQSNGLGGAGQLALSMVIAVIFVAILFRSPLPSATTTRWRK